MSISNDGAARLAEATVKLWDIQGNQTQGKFFRFTPQDFTTWKTDHEIRRTLGEDIEQNASAQVYLPSPEHGRKDYPDPTDASSRFRMQ